VVCLLVHLRHLRSDDIYCIYSVPAHNSPWECYGTGRGGGIGGCCSIYCLFWPAVLRSGYSRDYGCALVIHRYLSEGAYALIYASPTAVPYALRGRPWVYTRHALLSIETGRMSLY
jgi:hypothetical protein